MSIWDHMKKTARPPSPVEVKRPASGGLEIHWDDGAVTSATPRELRLGCQCAACIDEFTHKPLLDPATVPQDVSIARLEPIGNYALQLFFSDGHESGIFAWPLLRSLGSKR
jgi:ATP-binding protein involved in chromosome partitioning